MKDFKEFEREVNTALQRELAKIESNLSHERFIDLIVNHCSATMEGQDLNAEDIRQMHLRKGWKDIGYHFVILLDGSLELGRDLDQDGDVSEEMGAHVRGFNRNSIGVVYIGGLDKNGEAKDTRTEAQIKTQHALNRVLMDFYKKAKTRGHRELSPDQDGDGVIERHEWLKLCPCYNHSEEFNYLNLGR